MQFKYWDNGGSETLCISEKYVVLKCCWTCKGLYLHRHSQNRL